MRLALTATVVSLVLFSAACQSKPQPSQAKPAQPDPNKQHWEGSTDVLKNYRFPSSPKAARKENDFTFREKSGNTKKSQEAKEPK